MSVNTLISNMDILRGRVSSAFDAAKGKTKVSEGTKEIYEMETQKRMYDVKFIEEQQPYQTSPKKRGQTLQEFVLLFFYISLVIFTIAMMIYAFLEEHSYSAALKALALGGGLALAITAILIRAG